MLSLKTERLKRYKDVALLLAKYGRSDLVKQAGLEDSLEMDEHALAETRPEAEELAADLEKLGPHSSSWANCFRRAPTFCPHPTSKPSRVCRTA